MYTRTYHLDSRKYIDDMSLVKEVLLNLKGVEDVSIAEAKHSLTVTFANPLSEKQILSAINQCKLKRKGMH